MKRVENGKMDLISLLDTKVNAWRSDNNIFFGGCAFAAYVLSGVLRRAGVEYSVTAYCRKWTCSTSAIDPIGDKKSCSHLEIAVYEKGGRKIVFGGKWPDIGACYRKRYENPDPRVLRDYYYDLLEEDEWNRTYDIRLNSRFVTECESVFKAWEAAALKGNPFGATGQSPD